MTHTLDTIIDFINDNIFTQEDYDALPQATRDLFEEAQEIENQRQLAWMAEIVEIERDRRCGVEKMPRHLGCLRPRLFRVSKRSLVRSCPRNGASKILYITMRYQKTLHNYLRAKNFT